MCAVIHLPCYCGYNIADYFGHWVNFRKKAWLLAPKIFYTNWFHADAERRFIRPSFGENSRVLKWVCERRIKSLWGQVQWDGMGAPWERLTPKCPLCPLHHNTTVHQRHFIHCMRREVVFPTMWLGTRGLWHDTVTEWWARASLADLHHLSCLCTPQSPKSQFRSHKDRTSGPTWH